MGHWQTLANIDYRDENFERCLRSSKEALQLSPNHPNANFLLASSLLHLSDPGDVDEISLRLFNSWLLCPKELSNYYPVANGISEKHAASFLATVIRKDPAMNQFQSVIQSLNARNLITETVVTQLESRKVLSPEWLSFLHFVLNCRTSESTDDKISLDAQEFLKTSQDTQVRKALIAWFSQHAINRDDWTCCYSTRSLLRTSWQNFRKN